jgi:hypothetical protein
MYFAWESSKWGARERAPSHKRGAICRIAQTDRNNGAVSAMQIVAGDDVGLGIGASGQIQYGGNITTFQHDLIALLIPR